MCSYRTVYRFLKINTIFSYFHRISLNKYLLFPYFHLVLMLLTIIQPCDLLTWCWYGGRGGGDGDLDISKFVSARTGGRETAKCGLVWRGGIGG